MFDLGKCVTCQTLGLCNIERIELWILCNRNVSKYRWFHKNGRQRFWIRWSNWQDTTIKMLHHHVTMITWLGLIQGFLYFYPSEWKTDLNRWDCRTFAIIQNDTEIEPISWELQIKISLHIITMVTWWSNDFIWILKCSCNQKYSHYGECKSGTAIKL